MFIADVLTSCHDGQGSMSTLVQEFVGMLLGPLKAHREVISSTRVISGFLSGPVLQNLLDLS